MILHLHVSRCVAVANDQEISCVAEWLMNLHNCPKIAVQVVHAADGQVVVHVTGLQAAVAVLPGQTLLIEETVQGPPRMFPLQTERGVARPGPLAIPWELAEEAYRAYAQRYGREQSLERLAERGGFAWSEMDRFLPGWRDRA